MTYRKKLIEVALPLEAINVASAREKSIRHGHPSTLHLWWARRPLAAARAVIFTSLVDDPDSPDALPAFVEACKQLPKGANATLEDTPRMRLFDFIERLVTWEATFDESVLNIARELILISTEGNPPPLLDPFAGGGSIPLEAQRLGLEAHASDLNPVAVMINKAQIEIPPRFANMPPVNPRDRQRMSNSEGWQGAAGLVADVGYYGEWMRERAEEQIGHLYPKYNDETIMAWRWARTVTCPNPACKSEIPLVASFELSRRKGRTAWINPVVNKNDKSISFQISPNKSIETTKADRGAKFRCLVCEEVAQEEYIRAEATAGRMGARLIAIVTLGNDGRNYYAPNLEHETLAKSAEPHWKPIGEMVNNPRHMTPPSYGMTEYSDLFTTRQLTALTNFSDLVLEAREKVLADATVDQLDNPHLYADAVSVYLSFAIDKQADMNNSLCLWKVDAECPVHLFGRQAIPIVWDFVESNPFSAASGSWGSVMNNLLRSMTAVCLPAIKGNHSVTQQDARRLFEFDQSVVISTDPPYYDNVPYSDLADFFYIWLRRNMRSLYPDLFSTVVTPKQPELIADNVRHGSKSQAKEYFESGLQEVFDGFRQIVNHDYPITIYYAFKQADVQLADDDISSTGWETILTAVVKARFAINGTWPVRTELTRALKTNSNFLASSIVLVCRPRPENAPTTSRRAFVDALRRELPAALKEMQSGNIAPVDLAQASIGPGMAIYSRYSKVLEADGSPMSVRAALGLINQELDAYLAEQDGDIDGDTRFAVSWFEQFGFNEGEFGQADVLARAKNTSVAGVEAAGLVQAGRGKVKLKHWTEYDAGLWNPQEDRRPTVWEATHHLIERLNSHGETGSAMLMTKMPPDMAAEARNLAYRLYSICERKGWADHARDYNALVISWAGIGEETARLREAAESGQATQQMPLFGEE